MMAAAICLAGNLRAEETPAKAGIDIFQQSRKATGTVTDDFGPMAGVSVLIKGTAVGTVTDVDGRFSLDGVRNGDVLQVSFLGYVTQEITFTGQSLSIVLKEDAQALDEIVVVGYGVQKKRDLTGAISSVKMNDAPLGTFSTVSHALAGKAAGLRVTQSTAQPGAGATFRIRGETSIKAGNDPLVIIDGFPVSSSAKPESGNRYNAGSQDNVLEMINPNDIESIEVLKDASATAIYGSRAGHGVIIITTKRGQEGKTAVAYSGNVAVQSQSATYDVLDAQGYRTFRNMKTLETWRRTNGQGIYADYITPNPTPPAYTPRYTDAEVSGAQTTDWMSEVSRPGQSQSHNLSLSGGTQTAKYLASLNYFSQEGVIKNNDMERITLNLNSDYQLSKYVKTGLSLNLSRNAYDNVPLGMNENEYSGIISSAARYDPAVPVRNENGEYAIFPDQTQVPNPVSLLEITDKTNKERVLASGYLQAEPVQGLILKANVGFDRRAAKRKTYLPTATQYGAATNGSAYQTQSDGMDYLLNLTANYMKSFGRHSLTALAGYEYQQFASESFWASNYNFATDGFLYNNLGAGSGIKDAGSGASKSALGSYFGRINYSFAGKYLLTATIRADGASNFDPDYRWGYFPSVSAAWRFSDEAFMSGISHILSNGKLRAGYGQTGNSNVGNRTLDYFGVPDSNKGRWVFGTSGAVGIAATQLGNRKLTWETTGEFNVGLDLGFANNRINLSVEYYDRVISDLLVTDKSLPSYNELNVIAANIGKTQGQGLEITLNTVNIASRDLTWTSDFTFYTYKDRWLERDPNWKPAAYQSVDDPIRSIFIYESDGLLQAGEPVPAWQPALLPGQIKIKNPADEPGGTQNVLDQYDQTLLGAKDPAFTFGFNNTLRYKRLDLNVYAYGEVGRWRDASYYDSWIPYVTSNNTNMSVKALQSWTADNPNTDVPNVIQSSYGGLKTDYFYSRVNFLRFRNITLGYTVPVPKNILGSLRVYVDVNNPFVISNWNGLDPETDYNPSDTSGDNLSSYSYPNVRTFSFGVDIKF